jgi:hypothetical protein
MLWKRKNSIALKNISGLRVSGKTYRPILSVKTYARGTAPRNEGGIMAKEKIETNGNSLLPHFLFERMHLMTPSLPTNRRITNESAFNN